MPNWCKMFSNKRYRHGTYHLSKLSVFIHWNTVLSTQIIPRCIRICNCSVPLSANLFEQRSHKKFFSAVWVLRCLRRDARIVNARWHTSQTNLWINSLFQLRKNNDIVIVKTINTYRLSPLWILRCLVKFDRSLNSFEQTSQQYSFFPVCFDIWAFKLLYWL